MTARFFLALFLLLQAPYVASQAGPVEVRLTLLPDGITLYTGLPYNAPLRIRAVRVDNGQPVEGVGVQIYANQHFCFEGVDCGPYSLLESYGYFEGAGGSASQEARGVEVVTDSRGEATLPRLIGGTVPLDYNFAVSLAHESRATYRTEVLFVFLSVDQVAPPRGIPATNSLALGLLLLAVLVCAVGQRRDRRTTS